MTKEEVLATLTKTGDERFNEAVKAFSAADLLDKVRFTAKILVLKDGTEVSKDEL